MVSLATLPDVTIWLPPDEIVVMSARPRIVSMPPERITVPLAVPPADMVSAAGKDRGAHEAARLSTGSRNHRG